ncbi:magnesium transporter CorA family protein [Rufibacter tibetensis]|uniref:Magnesium transporter CorA n=1 Tax=Rufibacter tibetensis TaxID=512763 RepID=A0A0P0CI66_9BACT|nr:CorA family divalent cation transporter [Rufibacter tibetensis]ALJ01718.1 hypothetical protein DC20_21975 [Rufibacter tibetensis]
MQKTLVSAESAGWEWIDIEDPTLEELQFVAQKYDLHPSSVTDSLQPEHLPKHEFIEKVLFVITRFHDPEAHLEADTIQELTNKLAIFYNRGFLITIHKFPVPFIAEMKGRLEEGGWSMPAAGVLIKLLKASLRTFQRPALKLADELDYYEAKIFLSRKVPSMNKGLYHLKRKSAVSRRVIQLAETVTTGLTLEDFQQTEVQDLKDAFLLLENQYEEISESSNNLINTYISLASQRTNDVMRVLTIFSVFFMPLTFIAGIYGMNFEFMPELKSRWGYPGVLGAMVVVTGLIYSWFRRKQWL